MYPSINTGAITNNASLNPINSPCIFYDDGTLLQLLRDTSTNVDQTPINVLAKGYSSDDLFYNDSKVVTRETSPKKDRPRKINTVQGPRCPRMRLSLDVAKKFFWLQDMLGFDKASKTVQWLLNKSDTAIQQLITNSIRADNASSSNITGLSSTSISSECEVYSHLSLPREVTEMENAKQEAVSEKKVVTTRKSRNSRAFHSLEKETRERARERARQRTVEKRSRLGNGNNYNNLAKNVPYADRVDQNINGHAYCE